MVWRSPEEETGEEGGGYRAARAWGAMAYDNCTTDGDCMEVYNVPGMLCYHEENNQAGRLCQCNMFYGWGGDDCSEWTTQTYVLAASTLVQAILAVCMVFYFFAFALRNKMLLCMTRDVPTITLVWVMWALAGIAMWRLSEFSVTLTPKRAGISESDDKMWHPWSTSERVGITLAMFFVTMALLQVSLMWVRIATRAKQMRRGGNLNKLVAYRKFVVAFQGLWLVLLVILVALDELPLLIYAALPLMLTIVLTYLIGGGMLYNVLRKAQTQSGSNSKSDDDHEEPAVSSSAANSFSGFTRLMNEIRRTSLRVCAATSVAIVGGLTYAFTTTDRILQDDTTEFVSMCAAESIPLGYILTMWFIGRYVRRQKTKQSGSSSAALSSGHSSAPQPDSRKWDASTLVATVQPASPASTLEPPSP